MRKKWIIGGLNRKINLDKYGKKLGVKRLRYIEYKAITLTY